VTIFTFRASKEEIGSLECGDEASTDDTFAECSFLADAGGQRLFARHWPLPEGEQPRGLVFISHGFSEHLGLYQHVAAALTEKGLMPFGHDHRGHGRSGGKRAYIDDVDEYVDDIFKHARKMAGRYPNVPLFLLGHSMGGMVALRAAVRDQQDAHQWPRLFSGLALEGPLIIPGMPLYWGMDLRSTACRTAFATALLTLLDAYDPEMTVGKPYLDTITSCEEAKRVLINDRLRWTGGCKVHLAIILAVKLFD